MLNIPLIDLAKILGTRYQGEANIFPRGVAIDSRKVQTGDLFFALSGENFDGHDFVEEALQKGALAVVISDLSLLKELRHRNVVISQDPLDMLQKLAKLTRDNSSVISIGITGSTGKTTTKDFLHSILQQDLKTLKNEGNYNNELGVPLTLCQLDQSYEALVVEMGMRGLGQIDFLCQMAQPNHGIITNIGLSHAELLGSQEKIAQAKAELLRNLSTEGLAVLNCDDQRFLETHLMPNKRRILWFGTHQKADFRIKEIIKANEIGTSYLLHYKQQEYCIDLNIPGEYNIYNATAAIAIAHSLGLDWSQITKGLALAKPSAKRLDLQTNTTGIKIINDTYNASPDSMEAALKVLQNTKGQRKIAVLGDMNELGLYEQEGHQTIGRLAHQLGVDYLITVGQLAPLISAGAIEAGLEKSKVLNFRTNNQAIQALLDMAVKDDVILVKGSRALQMEKVVQGLMG